MANTYEIRTLDEEVVEVVRSTDFDYVLLYNEYGVPLRVYDRTDEGRYIGDIRAAREDEFGRVTFDVPAWVRR